MARRPLDSVIIAIVRAYQVLVSPWLGPRCRFYPTCSAYCIEAVREHGVVRGLGLAGLRILRCHPFDPGGFDPVPPRGRRATTMR